MSYAAPCPHGPIEPIQGELFMVRGSMRMNPLVRITRNMAIVRHEGELSLINPIRLTAAAEAELKQLGEIKRIIRLGPMHGIDDPWYVEQHGAEMWVQPGGTTYPEPKADVDLSVTTPLPFPNARLFEFQGTVQPECALLVEIGDGILLTCDAIQHYGDYSHNNWLARLVMPFIGFPKRTLVGPIWLRVMTPEGGDLEPEFRRLAELPFDGLFSAHGTLLKSGAKATVRRAIDLAFGGADQ